MEKLSREELLEINGGGYIFTLVKIIGNMISLFQSIARFSRGRY